MMKLKKLSRNLAQIPSMRKKFSSSAAAGIQKEKTDCVVIGAGVVGIAVARELCLNHNRNVLVIESASTFGTGSSSRNSEVIHGGIYYPPNSLKVSLFSSFIYFLLQSLNVSTLNSVVLDVQAVHFSLSITPFFCS